MHEDGRLSEMSGAGLDDKKMKPGDLLKFKFNATLYDGQARGHFLTGVFGPSEVSVNEGETCVFLSSRRGSKNLGTIWDFYTVLYNGRVMFSEHFNFERCLEAK